MIPRPVLLQWVEKEEQPRSFGWYSEFKLRGGVQVTGANAL